MKIFQITLRKGSETKYIYCKLEKIQDLSTDADFYNSYTDCKYNQNKITEKSEIVNYTHIMAAIKSYTERK